MIWGDKLKNFISNEMLISLSVNPNVVIADCRSDLMNTAYSENTYLKGHIDECFSVDLNTHLSAPQNIHGGRNPLPSIEAFKETLENLGITNDSIVIAYDELKIASAARFCFMLRCFGHKNNYILDGGVNNWLNSGYCLCKRKPHQNHGSFQVNVNDNLLVDYEYVKKAVEKENVLIIDSRTPMRYLGENEPIDKIAGHIPSAINIHWKNLLDSNGLILPLACLKEKLSDVYNYDEVIVYCGSGVDATFNYMLLNELGINAKVYIGSWSDWITHVISNQ